MWNEKYRPSNSENILIDDNIKSLICKTKNIPNLLFHGPPGTGKTTMSMLIIKELLDLKNLSKEEYDRIIKNNVLIINASDKKGIKLVRDTIKNFVNTPATEKFKFIMLDEFDAVSKNTQFALRKIMEDIYEGVRYIILCNFINNIIPPLISRCSVIKFNYIKYENFIKILSSIKNKEVPDIDITNDIYEKIYNYTKGDMRKSINIFQRICENNNFSNLDIYFDDYIPNDIILDIVKIIDKKCSVDYIYDFVNKLKNELLNFKIILNYIQNYLIIKDSYDKYSDIIYLANDSINNNVCNTLHILNILLYINNFNS